MNPEERWGYLKSDLFVINFPESLTSNQTIAIPEVLVVALSCMKKVRLSISSDSSGNVSINVFLYRSFVTVSCEPVSGSSKKAGPIVLVEDNLHQTVTLTQRYSTNV